MAQVVLDEVDHSCSGFHTLMDRIRVTGGRLGLGLSIVEVDGMRVVASESHTTVGACKGSSPAVDQRSIVDFNATGDALGAEGMSCEGMCE